MFFVRWRSCLLYTSEPSEGSPAAEIGLKAGDIIMEINGKDMAQGDRIPNDLNKLIRALEIYLTDYVEKEECNCVLPDIQEIVKENVKGAMPRMPPSAPFSLHARPCVSPPLPRCH